MKKQALTAIFTAFLLVAGSALAAPGVNLGSGSVDFSAGDSAGVITVSGPDGYYYSADIAVGSSVSMSLFDAKGQRLADGSYTWEIVRVKAQAPAERSAHIAENEALSGAFTIADGAVANPYALEGSSTKDQVFLDDLIVDGSACVGLDCANGESFGFDTLKLKENNLRIKFEDTSASASFPGNDWQLLANESDNGGLNKFSIEDVTGGKTPFTVVAGAPTNSLYVADTGNVGIGTNTPNSIELYIKDGDSPTLRLEQDGSAGFASQVWDVAGNETNFFVRDVTNGSKLPFKIRPQAPTDSLYVNTDGSIGLGTAAPKHRLHVHEGGSAFSGLDDTAAIFQSNAATSDNIFVSMMAGSAGNAQLTFGDSDNQFAGRVVYENNTGNMDIRAESELQFQTNGVDRLTITDGSGSDLITTSTGAALTSAGVWQSVSRRDAKTNIEPLAADAAMAAFLALEPVTYNYKVEMDDQSVGFIAEDVPDLVATASRKTLASLDLIALLTKVVQEQQKMIDDLSVRIGEIE